MYMHQEGDRERENKEKTGLQTTVSREVQAVVKGVESDRSVKE